MVKFRSPNFIKHNSHDPTISMRIQSPKEMGYREGFWDNGWEIRTAKYKIVILVLL